MTKTTTSHQPGLWERAVPRMPEGYYSSGPNPNLRRFVEEHAKPYDPTTDDYDVPPFDRPITTTKATAIYNMHTYWSKKPHDAIRQYIRHYTRPGDIVLDPFCGSGGTALAALMEGRTAIAIDLSPAATFITKNYCTPVDVDELQRAFEELERRVKPELDWLYATRCDRCEGRATTAYTVYSQVFQCPRCLEKVALFDCVEVMEEKGEKGQGGKGEKGKGEKGKGAKGQGEKGKGAKGQGEKGKRVRACPHCYARGVVEAISTRGPKFGALPVLVSYLCLEGCKPQRGERRHNDPDAKKRAYFEQYDLAKLREIEAREIPHWYPPDEFPKNFARWRSDLRLQNIQKVADLFTRRNLWGLAVVLAGINCLECSADALRFTLSGALMNATKMYQQREKGGTQKGTYYVPPSFREVCVWTLLEQKTKNLVRSADITASLSNAAVCISTQSAADINGIPSDTVDYVFTDPPYAGNVQYGELNFVWEAWLGFDTSWHDREIIVNQTRGKTEADWEAGMRRAMAECYRVLKPGRWISLCYHDTSEGTWQLVQDIMTQVGFIPEQSASALFIDTGQKSYNQLTAEKVTRRDLVINFRKPRPGEVAAAVTLRGDEDAATFQEKARAILRQELDAHPGSPADRLYDALVARMVRRGEFERHDFDRLLRTVAEDPRGDNHWYLLDTADQADAAESAREDSAAAYLEAMMRGQGQKGQVEGVHYSDLFEWYLPLKDKPRRLLQDWLPEYFVRTPEGTWRPPETEEERAQKAALRQSGALRRIKRFARALLEGVPPHGRDHPENVVTAADWLRQCRRAGLYELGRALYEKGGFRFDTLPEEAQLAVEEDYQVCVRRS
jgi:16S rRNA G966 N2-methylase RsmD